MIIKVSFGWSMDKDRAVAGDECGCGSKWVKAIASFPPKNKSSSLPLDGLKRFFYFCDVCLTSLTRNLLFAV
jgi:hypothetical protein